MPSPLLPGSGIAYALEYVPNGLEWQRLPTDRSSAVLCSVQAVIQIPYSLYSSRRFSRLPDTASISLYFFLLKESVSAAPGGFLFYFLQL